MTRAMLGRLCNLDVLDDLVKEGTVESLDVGITEPIYKLSWQKEGNITASLLSSTFYTYYSEWIALWEPDYEYIHQDIRLTTEGKFQLISRTTHGFLLIGDNEESWKLRMNRLLSRRIADEVYTLSVHSGKLWRYAETKGGNPNLMFGIPNIVYSNPTGNVWRKKGCEKYISLFD